MLTHRFLLTLGSNDTSEDHISKSCEALRRLPGVVDLLFSTPRRSLPISFGLSDALFTDVVVLGATTLAKEEFSQVLKALEHKAGRTAEQRRLHPEIIPIDIDLILWEGQVLKPQDLERPYLITGLQELGVADWRSLVSK